MTRDRGARAAAPQHRGPTYRRLVGDDDWAQQVDLRLACNDDRDDRSPTASSASARRRATVASSRPVTARGSAPSWTGGCVTSMGLVAAERGAGAVPVGRDPSGRAGPGAGRDAGAPRQPLRPGRARRAHAGDGGRPGLPPRSGSTARSGSSTPSPSCRRSVHRRAERAPAPDTARNDDVASPADRGGDVVPSQTGRCVRRAAVSGRRAPSPRGSRRRTPPPRLRWRSCRRWWSRCAAGARRTGALGATGALLAAATGGGLTAGALATAACATAAATAATRTTGAAGTAAVGAGAGTATARAATGLRALLHRRGHDDRVGEGALTRGQLAQQRVAGVQPRRGRRDAGLAGQVAHVARPARRSSA